MIEIHLGRKLYPSRERPQRVAERWSTLSRRTLLSAKSNFVPPGSKNGSSSASEMPGKPLKFHTIPAHSLRIVAGLLTALQHTCSDGRGIAPLQNKATWSLPEFFGSHQLERGVYPA
jgi:hypothetical protein